MRHSRLLALPLLVSLISLPVRAPAQVNLTVQFGARLGPEIGGYAYPPDRDGNNGWPAIRLRQPGQEW